MPKSTKPTRAERREQRASVPEEGIYGVDAQDAGASSWDGRYLMWASNADEADKRLRAAGFHKSQIHRRWTPRQPPPEGLPDALTAGFPGWFRSRLDYGTWTEWESLPGNYRHPSQALAAIDPTVR